MLTSVGDWAYNVDYGINGVSGSKFMNCEFPVIFVQQYIQSKAKLYLAGVSDGGVGGDAKEVIFVQETNYPWDGEIRITIKTPSAFKATIALRAPGWCDSPKVNHEAMRSDGYLYISKEWNNGDQIDLDLPMEVQELEANPYVSQDAGRTALRRGPLVYCVEGVDNGECLEDLLIPANVTYNSIWDGDLLGGVNKICFTAKRRKMFDGLYRKWAPEYEDAAVTAIPYYAWGNRGEGELAVWLRKETNV